MTKKYFVEIRGCNFHNKGDVLMAESIIHRINEERSDIRFVSRASRALNNHNSLLNPKDLGKCLTSRPSYSNQKLGKLIIKYATNFFIIKWLLVFVFKFVPEKKIDGIIDICGFSYGNYWGNQNLKSDLEYYTNAKKRGIPIILMPKTFGPITDVTQKRNMKKLWNACTLAFSRDSQSTKFLTSCGIKNIETFPDYTYDAKPHLDDKYRHLLRRPIIIPNCRMVDSGRKLSFDSYIDFLSSVYKIFNLEFGKPIILIHDSKKDLLVANALKKFLRVNVDIIKEPVARTIKGIIVNSSIVYSDRLHGAISAGLYGVPIISLGWSFKYKEMLKDFDLPWAQLKHSNNSQMVKCVSKVVINYKKKSIVKNSDCVRLIRQKNSLMWNKIFFQLNKSLP